jgi:LDH2 family malate/lactate/ureidoglycolate dehydrogenase
MSKEIEQNEHYTGKIAMSLDPSLVVKELDTGRDGLITKEAVRKQTYDPQEEIDQMKQTAKDEGAELDADQLARIKELETAAKVKQQEDDER